MRLVKDNANVVVRDKDSHSIITKKFGQLHINETFAFKDVDNVVGVAIKGLDKDELVFKESDWGRVFDYLMKL